MPYQLTQLDSAVKQAQVRCDVFAQAIAPTYGGPSVANVAAGVPVSGPAASGKAAVKINDPQQITVKS